MISPASLSAGDADDPGSHQLTINTSTVPDAIAGRSYTAYIATSASSISLPHGIPDSVSSCSLTGSFPTGMTAAPGTLAGVVSYCVLTIGFAQAPGQFSFTLTAVDSSKPHRTASHLYRITVHPDFTFATTPLAPGVQGRSYGVSPLAQTETTNIGTTVSGITIGHGPLTGCTVLAIPANPGLAVGVDATGTQCVLTSPLLTPAGTYTVTVSATETDIPDPVSAGVAVSGAPPVTNVLSLVVNPEITFSLNFDSAPGGSVGVVPDAVQGRTYGAPARTSLILTAQGGLMTTQGLIISGSGALPLPVGCVVAPATPPALPPGAPPETPPGTPVVSATNVTVTCAGGAVTATPGVVPFATTVRDPGNTATPPNTILADLAGHTAHTLTVRAEMTVTPPTTPPPPAVTSRRYGTGTGCVVSGSPANCAPLDYKLSGGLGNYTCTGSSLKTAQDTFTCALTSPNVLFSSAAIAGTTSPATLTFIGAETGNATTPGNATPPDTSQSLTINPELTVTAPASAPPPAVTGRHYGSPSDLTCNNGTPNVACAPLDYQLSNGLGNYSLTGSSLATSADAFTCTLSSPNFLCSVGSPHVINGVSTSSPYTLTFVGAETGNAATPGGSKTDTSQVLTVKPKLTLAQTDSLPSPLPAGVEKRSYGTGAGFTPLQYTAGGGLGSAATAGSYVFTPSGLPTNLTCPAPASPNANVLDCATPGVTVLPKGAAGAYTPKVLVDDVANTATPTASGSTTQPPAINDNLTVNPPLTLAETDGLPSPLPAGVDLRPYGGTGFTPLQFTAANGLGSAATAGSFVFTPSNLPTNLTCPAPAAPNANVLKCGTQGAAVFPSGTSGTSPYSVTVFVNDVKNQTTPDAVSSSTAPANIVNFLPVKPALAVTPPALVPAAVTGRDYGVTTDLNCSNGTTNVACSPLSYQLSNGLGGYTCTGSSLSDGTDRFSCALSSPNLIFSKTSIAAAAGSATLSFVGADTGNATTPGNTKIDTSQTLTVHSALAISSNLTSPFPDAVVHRDYGVKADLLCSPGGISACTPLVYTATGGLLNGSNAYVSMTPNGTTATAPGASFPLGFACTPNSPLTTLTCSAKPVSITVSAGTYSPAVTVNDSGNAATPADSQSSPGALNVDQGVAVTLAIGGAPYTVGTDWPTGVVGRPYGSGDGCTGGGAVRHPSLPSPAASGPSAATYSPTKPA